MQQIKPLLRTVAPIWETDASDYPDIVKVPMENGHIVTYRREIEQPIPQCMPQSAQEIIQILKRNSFGGQKKKGVKR